MQLTLEEWEKQQGITQYVDSEDEFENQTRQIQRQSWQEEAE